MINYKKLSIIIVTYNSEQYLNMLIKSILKQNYDKNAFEIIFVDNTSRDNTRKIIIDLKRKVKDIKIKTVFLDKNTGYCLGNNIGAKHSSKESEYLLFLNPDTVIDNNFIYEMVKYMEENHSIGLASSLIVFYNTDRLDNFGLYMDPYGAVLGRMFLKKVSELDNYHNKDPFFYAHGAALIIRKKIFDLVRGFDPILFMYHDDVDISWRVRLMGYEIGLVKNTKCYHMKKKKEFIYLSTWKHYFVNRNRIRILLKNYSFKKIIERMAFAIVLMYLRSLYVALTKKDALYLLYFLKAIIWNILKIKDTYINRMIIQRRRVVPDKTIEKYIFPYSLELAFIKLILRKSLRNITRVLC